MTEEAFWEVVRRAAEQPGDRDERADWLVEELTRLPLRGITDFQHLLCAVLRRADTAPVRAAARLLLDAPLSGEAFLAFRLWLLTLGRDAFAGAVADPDGLAEHPRVRALAALPRDEWADWPEWDGLAEVARLAYQEVTGSEELPECPERVEGHQDAAAVPLPRLTALFAPAR